MNDEKSKIFFTEEAQKLMKKITGLDLEKVYKKRPTGRVSDASYEFMTDKELKSVSKRLFCLIFDIVLIIIFSNSSVDRPREERYNLRIENYICPL